MANHYRLLLALLALTLLLPMAFAADPVMLFTHNLRQDSTSNMTAAVDFNAMKNYVVMVGGPAGETAWVLFSKNMDEMLSGACGNIMKKDKTTECSPGNLSLYMTRNFTNKDGYYSFEVTGEFPYRTYKLTVNRIPMDRFGRSLQSGFSLSNRTMPLSDAGVIDLRKDNSAVAKGYQVIGFGIQYVANMPGEVTSATAGSYNAAIGGSTASYDLVGVMENSAPLVVESRELNLLLIFLLAGGLLLVFLVLVFFAGKKKK